MGRMGDGQAPPYSTQKQDTIPPTTTSVSLKRKVPDMNMAYSGLRKRPVLNHAIESAPLSNVPTTATPTPKKSEGTPKHRSGSSYVTYVEIPVRSKTPKRPSPLHDPQVNSSSTNGSRTRTRDGEDLQAAIVSDSVTERISNNRARQSQSLLRGKSPKVLDSRTTQTTSTERSSRRFISMEASQSKRSTTQQPNPSLHVKHRRPILRDDNDQHTTLTRETNDHSSQSLQPGTDPSLAVSIQSESTDSDISTNLERTTESTPTLDRNGAKDMLMSSGDCAQQDLLLRQGNSMDNISDPVHNSLSRTSPLFKRDTFEDTQDMNGTSADDTDARGRLPNVSSHRKNDAQSKWDDGGDIKGISTSSSEHNPTSDPIPEQFFDTLPRLPSSSFRSLSAISASSQSMVLDFEMQDSSSDIAGLQTNMEPDAPYTNQYEVDTVEAALKGSLTTGSVFDRASATAKEPSLPIFETNLTSTGTAHEGDAGPTTAVSAEVIMDSIMLEKTPIQLQDTSPSIHIGRTLEQKVDVEIHDTPTGDMMISFEQKSARTVQSDCRTMQGGSISDAAKEEQGTAIGTVQTSTLLDPTMDEDAHTNNDSLAIATDDAGEPILDSEFDTIGAVAPVTLAGAHSLSPGMVSPSTPLTRGSDDEDHEASEDSSYFDPLVTSLVLSRRTAVNDVAPQRFASVRDIRARSRIHVSQSAPQPMTLTRRTEDQAENDTIRSWPEKDHQATRLADSSLE
ncbi:hypothetical protein BC939DRAFT_11192 [Gamsiella multidivaricata]|uniref:uncharacterized protein n=1 Tax=Gamsiella multidivaricata TaxID=101098 RepID=UPI00221F9A2F|nr:uncharacterized protein BC939DRAFT_11192 [Gamsiella multidivaricata]KAI7829562.1 hypothetical protein BC939DRAFT_11192 [Gamsiella multidivaricata]